MKFLYHRATWTEDLEREYLLGNLSITAISDSNQPIGEDLSINTFSLDVFSTADKNNIDITKPLFTIELTGTELQNILNRLEYAFDRFNCISTLKIPNIPTTIII